MWGGGALGAEAQTWVLTCPTVDHDVLVGEKTALFLRCPHGTIEMADWFQPISGNKLQALCWPTSCVY